MNGDVSSSESSPSTLAIPDPTPIGGSLLVGFGASLCCGGGLVFGAIGLGAFYGALGAARFIPEALAVGSISIGLINWLYYRGKAARSVVTGANDPLPGLRRTMALSTLIGVVMMAASFMLLEWLNHAVVNADRFMAIPRIADALIRDIPNSHLSYLAATFLVVPVVYFLPLVRNEKMTTESEKPVSRM